MHKRILVTGGAGYIGSHTVVELITRGYDPVIVDDLSNSNIKSLERIEKITGVKVKFYQFDICNKQKLNEIFEKYNFDSVIHFAGLKSVGESVVNPLRYYDVNINTTLSLLVTMQNNHVMNILFSSSATVYGDPQTLPLTEDNVAGLGLTNAYGRTKYFIEEILKDFSSAYPKANITILRYFNPIGAHESGLIGEDPAGVPNNLLPYISQVAVGKLKTLNVYGNDYDTPDGTGVRDYIHVVDLAEGHVAAIEHLKKGITILNLGTGTGVSVVELIHSFEKVSGKKIPYNFVDRRPGDIAACYADPSKAKSELGWTATRGIETACTDSWKWQQNNPNGYKS